MNITLRRPSAPTAPAPELGGTTYPLPSPVKPSALLVPMTIRDRVAEARTKRSITVAVLVTAGVLLLASAGAGVAHMRASHAYDEAAAAERAAEAKSLKYSAIATYYDGLEERKAALTQELVGDISFAGLTRTVLDAKPATLQLASVEVVPGQPCAGPNPFTPVPVLGCIKISGETDDEAAIGTYVDTLNSLPKDTAITQAFVNSLGTQGGDGSTQFSISANYTPDALTYRFVDPDEVPTTPATPTTSTTTPTTTTPGVTP